MKQTFAWKGNVIHTPECGRLELRPGSWLVCEDGLVAGVFDALPEKYRGIPAEDFGDKLILPGLIDLHVHASQYAYRGLGMDMELLDWLEHNAFPEESHFADPDYAARAYAIFTEQLRTSATTRACIFATLHRPATRKLMEDLERAGLPCLVGKVNMDRNSPDILRETTEESLAETRRWLEESGDLELVRPILTPRFTPSCSNELMAFLGNHYPAALAEGYKLPSLPDREEGENDVAWGYRLLEAAGRKRGFLISGGEVDTARMARILLDEFRGGKLGRFTLELP